MSVEVPPREAGGRPSVQLSSIAKAVRVLRALAWTGSIDAGITQLAGLASLPKSTTHRVLGELIQEGLVARTGQQRYRLGQGWFELQTALSRSEWVSLAERAHRPLAGLFEQTGATVHLGVLDGDEILYLEKLTAPGGTVIPTRVGGRMPATCTALGKCLLAHAAPERVRQLLAKPLPVASARSIATPRLLLRQLAKIRETGLAYDIEESHPGVVCVAAPILGDGPVVAAVSVSRVGTAAPAASDQVAVQRTANQIARWTAAAG